MAGLNKEMWISLLIGMNEDLWANDWFLDMGVNMDEYVEANSYVNFAHKGGIPNVTKNPTYPLATVTRTDIPDKIMMANYSTDRERLPRVDLMKLAYDKKDSVMKDHREALMNQIATEGLWNVSPFNNTAKTPVITTDSGNDAASDTFKAITSKDIMNLRVRLDTAYPKLKNARWVLVMDAVAFWTFVEADVTLKGQIQNLGKVGEVFLPRVFYHGFEIIMDARTAYYDATNERLSFGVTIDTASGDRPSATAFVANKSFAVARGDVEMFLDEQDSEYQADFASFLMPGIVTPFSEDLETNLKYLGAIIRK